MEMGKEENDVDGVPVVLYGDQKKGSFQGNKESGGSGGGLTHLFSFFSFQL